MHLLRLRHLLILAAAACAALGSASALRAVTPADLAARLERSESFLIVDVRPALAYQESHIPGAINIPLSLLPQKTLPSGARVIVYGDGLGLVGDDEALAIARELRVASVEVLEGGYAAWQSGAAPTTAASGVSRERLPGITYQQLVAAPKEGVVLVDLRVPAAARTSSTTASAAAASAPDIVDGFARQLGVPVRRSSAAAARSMSASSATSTDTAAEPAKAAAAIATDVAALEKTTSGTPPLLILVADSDAAASEAARQLRASGYHRFTILIGGTLTIEHQGRSGSERGTAESPVVHGQN